MLCEVVMDKQRTTTEEVMEHSKKLRKEHVQIPENSGTQTAAQ